MTLPITAPVTLTPLTLWLPLWAGPPQDRQLFDTISLLIQGSLDGELKLMDELAGPGGQPWVSHISDWPCRALWVGGWRLPAAKMTSKSGCVCQPASLKTEATTTPHPPPHVGTAL